MVCCHRYVKLMLKICQNNRGTFQFIFYRMRDGIRRFCLLAQLFVKPVEGMYKTGKIGILTTSPASRTKEIKIEKDRLSQSFFLCLTYIYLISIIFLV